ncbi:MAG: IS1595 family transposase [Acidobacteria bacterium]|nr:IS1595 family transposase [Acidobacteriota bacterium]
MRKQPSIFEHLRQFDSEEKCIAHFERIRWPRGLRCIRCKGKRVFKFETEGKTGKERHLYECVDCRYQFSVTTGTIFHDSHLPLTKWFLAIYMICSAKKGVSAKQLQRELDTSYKTAWYMAHRIRLAMQEDAQFCRKFSGVVVADETYIGGKGQSPRGRSTARKIPVLGIRERTSGRVLMKAVEDVSATTIADFIRENVKRGAELHTDEFPSYLWLDSSEFVHRSVNKVKGYSHRGVSTNAVENVWSLFKRAIVGSYHKVSAKYLQLYLHEFSFRFNNRDQFNLLDRVLGTCF